MKRHGVKKEVKVESQLIKKLLFFVFVLLMGICLLTVGNNLLSYCAILIMIIAGIGLQFIISKTISAIEEKDFNN